MEVLNNFIEQYSFLQKLFDVIRIIEPITRKEVQIVNGSEIYLEGSCYQLYVTKDRFI